MRIARSEGIGWGWWAAIGAGVLLILGAGALAIYGGTVKPPQHKVEQVLSNDRFPK